MCARDAGQAAAAEESFRAALARNPNYSEALLNMMELSFQQRNFLQTRAFVQRYLGALAPSAPVLLTCVNVERELDPGRHPRTKAYIDRILARPSFAPLVAKEAAFLERTAA